MEPKDIENPIAERDFREQLSKKELLRKVRDLIKKIDEAHKKAKDSKLK